MYLVPAGRHIYRKQITQKMYSVPAGRHIYKNYQKIYLKHL